MKQSSYRTTRIRNGALLGAAAIVAVLLFIYRPLALDIRLQGLLHRPTSIQRIQQHQGLGLQGTTVSVNGTVGDRAPFVGFEMYELKQNNASLWVMTRTINAQAGDRLRVRGTLQQESIEQNGVMSYEYYLQER